MENENCFQLCDCLGKATCPACEVQAFDVEAWKDSVGYESDDEQCSSDSSEVNEIQGVDESAGLCARYQLLKEDLDLVPRITMDGIVELQIEGNGEMGVVSVYGNFLVPDDSLPFVQDLLESYELTPFGVALLDKLLEMPNYRDFCICLGVCPGYKIIKVLDCQGEIEEVFEENQDPIFDSRSL